MAITGSLPVEGDKMPWNTHTDYLGQNPECSLRPDDWGRQGHPDFLLREALQEVTKAKADRTVSSKNCRSSHSETCHVFLQATIKQQDNKLDPLQSDLAYQRQ